VSGTTTSGSAEVRRFQLVRSTNQPTMLDAQQQPGSTTSPVGPLALGGS
jgi:hypothetical protein